MAGVAALSGCPGRGGACRSGSPTLGAPSGGKKMAVRIGDRHMKIKEAERVGRAGAGGTAWPRALCGKEGACGRGAVSGRKTLALGALLAALQAARVGQASELGPPPRSLCSLAWRGAGGGGCVSHGEARFRSRKGGSAGGGRGVEARLFTRLKRVRSLPSDTCLGLPVLEVPWRRQGDVEGGGRVAGAQPAAQGSRVGTFQELRPSSLRFTHAITTTRSPP